MLCGSCREVIDEDLYFSSTLKNGDVNKAWGRCQNCGNQGWFYEGFKSERFKQLEARGKAYKACVSAVNGEDVLPPTGFFPVKTIMLPLSMGD